MKVNYKFYEDFIAKEKKNYQVRLFRKLHLSNVKFILYLIAVSSFIIYPHATENSARDYLMKEVINYFVPTGPSTIGWYQGKVTQIKPLQIEGHDGCMYEYAEERINHAETISAKDKADNWFYMKKMNCKKETTYNSDHTAIIEFLDKFAELNSNSVEVNNKKFTLDNDTQTSLYCNPALNESFSQFSVPPTNVHTIQKLISNQVEPEILINLKNPSVISKNKKMHPKVQNMNKKKSLILDNELTLKNEDDKKQHANPVHKINIKVASTNETNSRTMNHEKNQNSNDKSKIKNTETKKSEKGNVDKLNNYNQTNTNSKDTIMKNKRDNLSQVTSNPKNNISQPEIIHTKYDEKINKVSGYSTNKSPRCLQKLSFIFTFFSWPWLTKKISNTHLTSRKKLKALYPQSGTSRASIVLIQMFWLFVLLPNELRWMKIPTGLKLIVSSILPFTNEYFLLPKHESTFVTKMFKLPVSFFIKNCFDFMITLPKWYFDCKKRSFNEEKNWVFELYIFSMLGESIIFSIALLTIYGFPFFQGIVYSSFRNVFMYNGLLLMFFLIRKKQEMSSTSLVLLFYIFSTCICLIRIFSSFGVILEVILSILSGFLIVIMKTLWPFYFKKYLTESQLPNLSDPKMPYLIFWVAQIKIILLTFTISGISGLSALISYLTAIFIIFGLYKFAFFVPYQLLLSIVKQFRTKII